MGVLVLILLVRTPDADNKHAKHYRLIALVIWLPFLGLMLLSLVLYLVTKLSMEKNEKDYVNRLQPKRRSRLSWLPIFGVPDTIQHAGPTGLGVADVLATVAMNFASSIQSKVQQFVPGDRDCVPLKLFGRFNLACNRAA